MVTSFDRAFDLVIGVEGEYSNDPRDPGGETKWGISKRAHPTIDVKNLTLEGAKAIYRARYWDLVLGDKLPWPLALFVFDAAVNQGVPTAVKLLQRVVQVPQDGIMGVHTLAALDRCANRETPCLYMAERALAYTGTRNFDLYGRGWFKRLFVMAAETR